MSPCLQRCWSWDLGQGWAGRRRGHPSVLQCRGGSAGCCDVWGAAPSCVLISWQTLSIPPLLSPPVMPS